MPYVITSICDGVCDTACVHTCPVDSIHGPLPVEEVDALPPGARPLQLYIDPGRCITCGACAAACPVEAIFDEDDVPLAHRDAIEENAAFFRD